MVRCVECLSVDANSLGAHIESVVKGLRDRKYRGVEVVEECPQLVQVVLQRSSLHDSTGPSDVCMYVVGGARREGRAGGPKQ